MPNPLLHQRTARHTVARRARRTAGFTLTEILLSLGIFAIGMTAVASLLPVAAILQRETVADVFASHAAGGAEAVMKNRGLTFYGGGTASDLGATGYHTTAGSTKTTIEPITSFFFASQRAYPTAQLNGNSVENCEFFWVPFIQDIDGDPTNGATGWTVKIFVLEGDTFANYSISTGGGITAVANSGDSTRFPKVVSTSCSVSGEYTLNLGVGAATHGLQAGDKVLDNNGSDYTVSLVDGSSVTMTAPILRTPNDPTTVWFAPPLGGSSGSPTKAIITVSDLNIITTP